MSDKKEYDNSKSLRLEVGEDGYIYCGKAKLGPEQFYDRRKGFVNAVLNGNGLKTPMPYVDTTGERTYLSGTYEKGSDIFHDFIEHKSIGIVAFNKEITDLIGGSSVSLHRWYKKLYKKQYMVPFSHMIGYFYYGSKHTFSRIKLAKAYEYKDIVLQAHKDKLYNIIPLVIEFCMSPQELRQKFGKGVWKKLCSNTTTRNKHLAYFGDNIPDVIDIPSTLLQVINKEFGPNRAVRQDNVLAAYLKHLSIHDKGHWGDRPRVVARYGPFRDTRRMAMNVGAAFNPEWSPRRLIEEHDRLAGEERAALRRRDAEFNNKPFEFTENWPETFSFCGYTAHRMDKPLDLIDEGEAQRHCVAGYGRAVARGEYLVYSIRKNGKRSSTLGLTVQTDAPWPAAVRPEILVNQIVVEKRIQATGVSFQQHYLKFDKPVTDPAEVDFSYVIVEALNDVIRRRDMHERI